MSSLLYASETWLTYNLKVVEKMYISAVKAALGVRETSRSDTVLIEAGMPSVKQLVTKRTSAFLKKEFCTDRTIDTPLLKIYKICQSKRTGGYRFLTNIRNQVNQSAPSLIDEFRTQTSSKAMTYKAINPELSVHQVYTTTNYIDERERLIFTRFRLSSHHLKIETGRWARIDVENRVCDCGGGIQDESHVLFTYAKTDSIRRRMEVRAEDFECIGEMMDTLDVTKLVPYVYNCMKVFE